MLLLMMMMMMMTARPCLVVGEGLTPGNPTWNMPFLTPDKPDGGASVLPGVEYLRLFFASKTQGTYNMSPMLSFLNGMWLASFKNSPRDEDQPGQRVLYSQSLDGIAWTDPSDASVAAPSLSGWANASQPVGVLPPPAAAVAPRELFPNISTESHHAALFAEPTVLVNGRVYAAASPKQFCLYPDQYSSVLLLRQVYDGALDSLGPVFWASKTVPSGWEENSAVHAIPTVLSMPAETQGDVAVLLNNATYAPCAAQSTLPGHTTKCEFCYDGCQNWTATANVTILENERTHYLLPGTGDVILYRSKGSHVPNFLYASKRPNFASPWPVPSRTNITDDVANLNAGNLPDGRAYLVSNAMVGPFRNPLYVSRTDDTNLRFVDTDVIVSCEMPIFTSPHQPFGCEQRVRGGAKQGGCQYPQALAITGGDFYTIFSLNKEDIWLLRFPISEMN